MTFKDTFLKLLTRKQVAFYLSWASVTLLTWAGKLSGDNFLIIAPTILVILVGGNVYSKYVLNNKEVKQ